MTLRVVELFSGIGAQRSALDRAGIPYESVACCEIDHYAYASYCAIHGDTPNLGDITRVEHLPDCDLLTYSFPCQSISLAGKKEGFEKGSSTASSLLWEVQRLLADAKERGKLPAVLQMENVAAITNKKNIANFNKWIEWLSSIGYTNTYKCLNAKDFDIPQNRNRCFMISRLDGKGFEFPEGKPKTRHLRDVLESDVPETYYLSEKRLEKLVVHRERNQAAGRGFGFRVTAPSGDASAVLTRSGREEEETLVLAATWKDKGRFESSCRAYNPIGDAPTIPTCTGGGIQPKIVVGANLPGYEKNGRCYSAEGLAPTVQSRDYKDPINVSSCASAEPGIPIRNDTDQFPVGTVQGMRIRRLTPRECWRLMDFTDEDYDRAAGILPSLVNVIQYPDGKSRTWTGSSKSQLYKQAGNSICVGVLAAIYAKLYSDERVTYLHSLEAYL